MNRISNAKRFSIARKAKNTRHYKKQYQAQKAQQAFVQEQLSLSDISFEDMSDNIYLEFKQST